jgi:O-antigen/teichoic acid export membrane protein
MTNRKRTSGFARNAIANWTSFAFTALVSFFLSPFIVQHLGATQYGVWALAAQLVLYLALLDFGIQPAVSRYVARHRAVDEHGECSSYVSAATKIFGLLGIVAILLSVALALLAPSLFNIPEALVDDARIVIVLGGLSVAAALVNGAFMGALTGAERFDVSCSIEILVTVIRAAAIVIALREGYGLVMLACIHLGTALLNCLAFWATIHKFFAEMRLSLRGVWLPHARSLLSFAASVSVIILLSKLIAYSDSVIIAAFLPIEAVTFFVIGSSLCLYAKQVVLSLSYLMTPRASALSSVGSDRVGSDTLAVAGVATLIATPMVVTFMIRGESFITLWMGPEYGPASGKVLLVLAAVAWLEAARSVVMHTLMGMGKQPLLIPGVAAEAVIKLALSVALVIPFGIVGVALGSLVPSVLMTAAYIPYCLAKAAGVPVALFHRKALLLPTVACVPFALASAVLERYVPATNLAIFFAQVFLILPLVPVFAWFLCLTAAEKNQVRLELGKLVRR